MFVSVVKFGGVLQLKVQKSGKQVVNDMSLATRKKITESQIGSC